MSKRIQVVLSNDESDKLDKLAEDSGRSLSNMARRLIIDGMKPKVDFNFTSSYADSSKIANIIKP